MKILSASQIRQVDLYTIQNEPIRSIDLMERASEACFDWIENLPDTLWNRVVIFCGVGNNGGDGLAIARFLASSGYDVLVYLVRFSKNESKDFAANLKRLKETNVKIEELSAAPPELTIEPEDLLIDAIFGSGLSKPIEGWVAELVGMLNRIAVVKISIDMPSGVFCEYNDSNNLNTAFKADFTLGLQLPKLAYVLEASSEYCGEWEILDIGLDEGFIEEQESTYSTIDNVLVSGYLKTRKKVSHKGDYGHALIVAGSKGKMGASILASRACLKSGIGLLTNLSPAWGANAVQIAVPESMVIVSDGNDSLDGIPEDLDKYNVIGLGPGIGISKETSKSVEGLISTFTHQMVIDADALNILAENKNWLERIPANSILTPHPGEFKRMVGPWISDEERIQKQLKFAQKYRLIVILKGSNTCVAFPNGQLYFNTSGNPGMASAGSGDVLLGIITALLGRGYLPEQAALLGVFMHGLAGDYAALSEGEESMVAGDLVNHISNAFKHIYDL